MGRPWLVTGSTGKLGRHVVRVLAARGTPATGLSRHPIDPRAPGVDIADARALDAALDAADAPVVLHLAACSSVALSAADPAAARATNVDATAQIARCGGARAGRPRSPRRPQLPAVRAHPDAAGRRDGRRGTAGPARRPRPHGGVVHLAGPQALSAHDMAVAVCRWLGAPLRAEVVEVADIRSGPRPGDVSMTATRLRSLLGEDVVRAFGPWALAGAGVQHGRTSEPGAGLASGPPHGPHAPLGSPR